MKRFAAARPMPVAPPVMTAVFPFSLVMSCASFVGLELYESRELLA
jgi:hypothetical protein